MPTILVVDDVAVERRLVGGLLEKDANYKVQYAANGKEAVEQIDQQAPDLVLTDLQMPEMNGLELVAAVKKDYPLVPVILMTARGSEEVAAQALREGAAGYVPKRRLGADLLPTVQRVLLGSFADRAQPHLMHYLEAGELVFVLSNDLALIKTLVAHLQQLLRCLPLRDETERLRVGIAVEEALTNACYHGNLQVGTALGKPDRTAYDRLVRSRLREAPYQDRQIHVSARITRDEAVFVVRDEGPGFDVSQLPSAGLPDADGGGWRGITMMRSVMDEVSFNETGNEVKLVKRRLADTAAGDE